MLGKLGGDCSAVQDQLKNVQHIQGNDSAFAAILGDVSRSKLRVVLVQPFWVMGPW